MRNLKKKVKQDLTNKLDIDLKYDKTQILENESKPKRRFLPLKIALISVTCSIVMVFAVPILMIGLQTHDSFKMAKKQYSIHEINNLENNSFKSLNSIAYPSSALKENIINESFKNGYNNFSYQTYKNLNKQDNFAYSPASLYSNLSLLSLASNDLQINETIDDILGTSKDNRNENYKYFYLTVVNNTGKNLKDSTYLSYCCYDAEGNVIQDSSEYIERLNKYEETEADIYYSDNAVKIVIYDATIYTVEE